ncbi:hypothetical protein HYPSUDRAFT_151446 [Hypholoma sublateritium FD-334 SS-4]|uniref:Uncharacterized protein n=1 Tax=Hypholoma sublateritium (strain FD-334 SS-4) TaxID=945553 RepID=A0A0D2NAF9_HYPSF|nr:hypothetical protein HYPSUDRAFT_151446 [Hypholoma sublateritium FD-334 SS-4]
MNDLATDESFDAQILLCEACGRGFAHMNAYSNHTGSCRQQKKRMASALGSAKEKYRNKKARLEAAMQLHQDELGPQPATAAPTDIAPIPDVINSGPGIAEPACLAGRRPRRENRRLPLRYRTEPAVPPASLPPAVTHSHPPNDSTSPVDATPKRRLLKSPLNVFGLFRQYFSTHFPDHDPDSNTQAADLSDVVADHSTVGPSSPFLPYPNQNAFLLGEWYWNNGLQKTKDGFRKLVDIISAASFNPADVRNIGWDLLHKRLAEPTNSEDIWLDEPDASWKETSITLPIPFDRNTPNPGVQLYTFPPLCHRSIVSILKEKMANPRDFQNFHLEPYELRWRRKDMSDKESTRVHGELYTSPIFLETHEEIQALDGEPGCTLPRVLIGLMFGSDATHLTSFGSASLWPCYMYFGNESKYRRCKPTCNLCNHIAYFRKLPPEFQDFATLHSGNKNPSQAFMTHCQREFFHAQWKVLLDDDFIEAYEHGVVIECCDGIKRRFYLRIFAYSADYPEKVLLTSIRNMGNCPCPRCLTPKDLLDQLGTGRDKNRRVKLARVDNLQHRVKISSSCDIIYIQNRTVNSIFVENILKPESWVPTENAFSHRLSPFGFNLFSIFLVDFMHEFELGVWKKVFIHLLRILECIHGATNKLDQRFRDMPTFGRDSIRRFTNSVSELKKLGARDYENILQCSMPVFEGLLPDEHNQNLMDLLFILAHWHALAKLRQHTELSLDILESVTIQLGQSLRDFEAKTCSAYDTRELKREETARRRHAESAGATNRPNSENAAGALPKVLNLNTYKDHSLGDYVETIRQCGTVDSYSTESMELEHRSPKSRYLRTNRKDFEKQLGSIERRQARIRRIRQKLSSRARETFVHEKAPESSASTYHIGKTQSHPLDLGVFARDYCRDPAAKDFTTKLKEHLFPRVQERLQIAPENLSSDTSVAAQVAQYTILIKNNRVYNHKLARFYHTTYDVRRSEDVVNPNTPHCNVMLLANTEQKDVGSPNWVAEHPFLYGCVLGIYHVNVVYTGPGMIGYEAMRFDFLYVRWFQLDRAQSQARNHRNWASLRLDRLSFPPMNGPGSFGFIDPGLVLRGCHLIPAYSLGRIHLDGIGLSKIAKDSNDWKGYYANRFADRDMAVRYHWGLGIGHIYSHGRNTPPQHPSTTFSAHEPEDPEALPNPSCSTPSNSGFRAEDDDGDKLHGSELDDPDAAPGEAASDEAAPGKVTSAEVASDEVASDEAAFDEAASDEAASERDSLEESSDRDDDTFLELYDTYYSD